MDVVATASKGDEGDEGDEGEDEGDEDGVREGETTVVAKRVPPALFKYPTHHPPPHLSNPPVCLSNLSTCQ